MNKNNCVIKQKTSYVTTQSSSRALIRYERVGSSYYEFVWIPTHPQGGMLRMTLLNVIFLSLSLPDLGHDA